MHRKITQSLIAVLASVALVLLAVSIWYKYYAPVSPFLIYYGGLPSQSQAPVFEKKLNGYPVVLLGTGLDSPAVAKSIIRMGKKGPHPIRFYGYISIGITHQAGNHSTRQVQSLLHSWRQIGVYGVLYDTAGPDFGVSQQRLTKLVKLAHKSGLYVIVNSWYPQAVMHVGLTTNDGYLAENWYASAGDIRSTPAGTAYVAQLKNQHIPIYMTGTGKQNIRSLNQSVLKAWIAGSKRVAGGQYIAISDENYSADTDYVEPASALIAAIHSFFPFGL